jgi:hypothetical protein
MLICWLILFRESNLVSVEPMSLTDSASEFAGRGPVPLLNYYLPAAFF